MKQTKIALLLSAWLLSGALRLAAQECDRLQGASPERLVSYLDGIAPDEENGQCIAFAINKLGEVKYEPSIPAMARLLDFRRPPTDREKRGTYIRMQGFYPGVNALEEIGKSALPALLSIIKSGSSSAVARANAIEVWMELYKYDESPTGVAGLRLEADKSADPAVKRNLMWALTKALSWCNPSDMARCKAAAKTGLGD